MKKKILQLCPLLGMMIYAMYNLVDNLTEIEISVAVVITVRIIFITSILVGLVYIGWCWVDKMKKNKPEDASREKEQ